jgi:hypothetical protein
MVNASYGHSTGNDVVQMSNVGQQEEVIYSEVPDKPVSKTIIRQFIIHLYTVTFSLLSLSKYQCIYVLVQVSMHNSIIYDKVSAVTIENNHVYVFTLISSN